MVCRPTGLCAAASSSGTRAAYHRHYGTGRPAPCLVQLTDLYQTATRFSALPWFLLPPHLRLIALRRRLWNVAVVHQADPTLEQLSHSHEARFITQAYLMGTMEQFCRSGPVIDDIGALRIRRASAFPTQSYLPILLRPVDYRISLASHQL